MKHRVFDLPRRRQRNRPTLRVVFDNSLRGFRWAVFLGAMAMGMGSADQVMAQDRTERQTWLRVGWFAPTTSFSSTDPARSVRLSSGVALGLVTEWSLGESWRLSTGLDGAITHPIGTVGGRACEEQQMIGQECSGRDPGRRAGAAFLGHLALARDIRLVTVGLGAGPRLLEMDGPDCSGLAVLCGAANEIHRQRRLTAMGVGSIGVRLPVGGTTVRLDLLNGLSRHRGSLQHEMILSGGVPLSW